MQHIQTLSTALASENGSGSKSWVRLVSSFGRPRSLAKALKKKEVEPWQIELRRTANKYHFTAAWVGVIFNLVFGLADYLNSPQFWVNFMTVRVVVSAIITTALFLYLRKLIISEYLIFVAVIGISLQNAYMWSQMDVVLLQKHTLAYIALFIGGGMLVVWRIKFSVLMVIVSLVGNIVAFNYFSTLSTQEIMASGGLLTLSVAIFSILLIHTRYRLTKREIISRLALEQANLDIRDQKQLVEEKQIHITESIQYAKTIQDAMLPNVERMQKCLPNFSVFYRPRDIVSGDFFWCERVGDKTVIAAIDCTGHGVPGAFMSMIGNTLLNEIVKVKGETSPKAILDFLRAGVIRLLSQDKDNVRSDSMDMALCTVDLVRQEVAYAGAYNPLYFVRNKELIETKADKMPIGYSEYHYGQNFSDHTFSFEEGDVLYLFTDGFADQFGGPSDKKYSGKRMRNFLTSISGLAVEEQRKLLSQEFDRWKGEADQIDDVLVICIKPKSRVK